MWYLTKLAMKKRAVTLVITALVIAASIWSLFELKKELIPDIELPIVTVFTIYPDASLDEVESEVTSPIERVISERWKGKGLEDLFSASMDELSVIFANFDYGTDMAKVDASIQHLIETIDFPEEVQRYSAVSLMGTEGNPQVVRLNLSSMMPLVYLSVSGDFTPDRLKDIADEYIVSQLRSIEGVFSAESEGGDTERLLVALDPELLNQAGVSMHQVSEELSSASEYESLAAVQNVSIGTDGAVLGDVAEVRKGQAPRTMIIRTNGKTSVGIVVFKEQEANTVEVANAVVDRVREIEEELQGLFGDAVEISTLLDQSEFIEQSVSELTQMALIGGALAIIVVFFFLMAFRASLITAMSIPMSVLIGFLVMQLSGITINMLTLSAMAIAVGRLIDNSIVVAEVIYRRLRQGEDFRDASINGAKEVATPITSSTLATVAIFIPLVFVGGFIGELFIPFGLTITYALIASLVVALMVVPALSNFFVDRKKVMSATVKSDSGETWYQKLYMPSLRWVLGHRVITLLITAALFFGSLGLIPVIGTSFMPEMSEKMLFVNVELPSGTDIEVTDATVAQVEKLFMEMKEEGIVEIFRSSTGTSTSMQGAMTAAMGGGDNTAEIVAIMDPEVDLEKERDDLERACKELEKGEFISVETGSSQQSSMMGFAGLEINVLGEDFEDLKAVADELYVRLEGLKGLANLETELAKVVPKLVIDLDYGKIGKLELSPEEQQQLGFELRRLKMGGSLAGVSVNLNGESYGVFLEGVVGNLLEVEDGEETARALRVSTRSVALADIAEVSILDEQTHINHFDQKRAVSISGDITATDVGAVNRAIQKEIDAVEYDIETGAIDIEGEVTIEEGGIAEEMSEGFRDMTIAVVFAIVIAFVIVAVSMRSILNPLIIMVSLPLAAVGALLALLIGGHTIGMSGAMGILMLVGIVLTNAIVLIDLVERLRKDGASTYDALIEGGRTRLRPILMTALTTMIAMIPLALGIGEGTLLAAELAVVVIGGLFSSTLLTLLVIPVIYSLVDGLRRRRVGTG